MGSGPNIHLWEPNDPFKPTIPSTKLQNSKFPAQTDKSYTNQFWHGPYRGTFIQIIVPQNNIEVHLWDSENMVI